MSIFERMFDSDWKQRTDINELESLSTDLIEQLGNEQVDQRKQIRQLQEQVAGLALVQRTILKVLSEKGLITPEEFQEQLKQFDLEDGKLDGR